MYKIEQFDGVTYAESGDVAIAVWRSAAREHRLRWMRDRLVDQSKRNEPGVMLMQVVLPGSSTPDGPARAASREMLQELGPRLRHLVTVAIGDALWVSIVRTILRGMVTISGHSRDHSVADTPAAGFERMRTYASTVTPTRAEMVEMYAASLRALEVDASEAPVGVR